MKKLKVIAAGQLTHMPLHEFLELVENNTVEIKLQKKILCQVVDEIDDEPEDIKVMNFTKFTRTTKFLLKEFFQKEGAVIKLVTNAHHQKICYLIP